MLVEASPKRSVSIRSLPRLEPSDYRPARGDTRPEVAGEPLHWRIPSVEDYVSPRWFRGTGKTERKACARFSQGVDCVRLKAAKFLCVEVREWHVDFSGSSHKQPDAPEFVPFFTRPNGASDTDSPVSARGVHSLSERRQ